MAKKAGVSFEVGVFDDKDVDRDWPRKPKEDAPDPELYSSEQQETPFTQCPIDTDFDDVSGLLLVPVAGPDGTPPEICKVHANYSTRTTRWSFEQIGKKPDIPDPCTGDPHTLLQERCITVGSPISLNGDDYIWRVSGVYVYILDVGRDKSDPLPAGAPPAFTTAANKNWIDVYDDTILKSPETDGGTVFDC